MGSSVKYGEYSNSRLLLPNLKDGIFCGNENSGGSLVINFYGAIIPVDIMVDIFFNNQHIGKASIKRGFRISVDANYGENILLISGTTIRKEYQIHISDLNKNYKILLDYSRISRNFTDSYNME